MNIPSNPSTINLYFKYKIAEIENMPESQYPVMLWCGSDAVKY